MTAKKLFFNWSSGKDSALALYYLLQDVQFRVDLLVTTINLPPDRISMHGIRRELLYQQFKSIGLPHRIIDLPEKLTMEIYTSTMNEQLKMLQQEKYQYAGFGDILLEDVKAYRENQLDTFQLKTIFPLWQRNTADVVHDFIEKGFRAIVVSINAALLDPSFCGRILDKSFLQDLPPGVDPCGENGEYHTFCFDGPLFKMPVPYTIGEKVYKEYSAPKNPDDTRDSKEGKKIGFWFCDLIPKRK